MEEVALDYCSWHAVVYDDDVGPTVRASCRIAGR